MNNTTKNQMPIRCTGCGQPYNAVIRNMIDVAQDPQAKADLLSGQINTSQCPHCGTVNSLAVPIMYHDSSKELLVALVPMELNMNKDQQERVVGDLMKSLPKENFKGYMFNPKRALTMQGLVELILQADGITPEVMEQQKQRVLLIQQFVEATDEALPALIQQYDPDIDLQFFQTMSLMAQRVAQSGRPDIAERIMLVQQLMLENTTFGANLLEQQAQQDAIVQEVAQQVQALGEQAQRTDFLALARHYANDNDRLQALVGLVRPVFDYQFFQELATAIGQEPAADRKSLEDLRDKLLEFTEIIDQQAQRQVQVAVNLLQTLVNMPEEEQAILLQENLPLINDTFMAVLTANIQEAERRHDLMAVSGLKQIYEKVVAMLQATMQPELVFVNQLLSTDNDNEAHAMIEKEARTFGEPLLDVMDAVEEVLTAQGNTEMVERLSHFRDQAEAVLNS